MVFSMPTISPLVNGQSPIFDYSIVLYIILDDEVLLRRVLWVKVLNSGTFF